MINMKTLLVNLFGLLLLSSNAMAGPVGDTNDDGLVNMNDVIHARMCFGHSSDYEISCEGADMNGNGFVNYTDYGYITKFIYGGKFSEAAKTDPAYYFVASCFGVNVKSGPLKHLSCKGADLDGTGFVNFNDIALAYKALISK